MSEQNSTEYKMTGAEKKIFEVLINPDHRMKKISDKCKIAGISRTMYYKIFKRPAFVEYYKKASKAMIAESVGPIINAAVKEATRGSYNHIKLVLEMAGVYEEKSKLEITGELDLATTTVVEREKRKAELRAKMEK